MQSPNLIVIKEKDLSPGDRQVIRLWAYTTTVPENGPISLPITEPSEFFDIGSLCQIL